MNFIVELILVVVAFISGYTTCFFVLRNNPKLLNLEKLAKEELYKLKYKVEDEIRKVGGGV